MRASAEEMCDHLINVWIARHGCPITFQSDNGKAFVGDLTKEFLKGSTRHLSPTNAWPGRKTESHISVHVEGLLLTVHGRLG